MDKLLGNSNLVECVVRHKKTRCLIFIAWPVCLETQLAPRRAASHVLVTSLWQRQSIFHILELGEDNLAK